MKEEVWPDDDDNGPPVLADEAEALDRRVTDAVEVIDDELIDVIVKEVGSPGAGLVDEEALPVAGRAVTKVEPEITVMNDESCVFRFVGHAELPVG